MAASKEDGCKKTVLPIPKLVKFGAGGFRYFLSDYLERRVKSSNVDAADVQVLLRIHLDVVDLWIIHL
jgi:hypothetical protein